MNGINSFNNQMIDNSIESNSFKNEAFYKYKALKYHLDNNKYFGTFEQIDQKGDNINNYTLVGGGVYTNENPPKVGDYVTISSLVNDNSVFKIASEDTGGWSGKTYTMHPVVYNKFQMTSEEASNITKVENFNETDYISEYFKSKNIDEKKLKDLMAQVNSVIGNNITNEYEKKFIVSMFMK